MFARRLARTRGFVAAAVIGSLIAAVTPTFADGTADEADLHFELGLGDFGKGNYDSALVHFFASNRLVPNRNVLFNIARTYEAMKRYTDAHRYYSDSREGETDAKKRADADAAIARLAPNVAVLKVTTTPAGATIYINRKDLGSRGVAPRTMALPPGKYTVIAELSGYESRTSAEVEVTTGKETALSLELPKIVGTVHVDVTGVRVSVAGGPAADVRVDDEKAPVACKAPCDFPLSPGRHELYFSAPGFEVAPRTVVVEAGKTATATATLVPLTGSIVVSADERDALVSVDGKRMGFTPTVLQNVPVGQREIVLQLRGFSDFKKTVEVRANQQTDLGAISLVPAREVNAVSRQTETVDDAPSSVTIIDRREIQAFGYPTIAEALRGVRGVTLNNDHAYASASIRGVGQPNDYGNRLLVLSDGQSLNDNLLNSSYIGSDGRVDLHDVDRIEVVRGPGSLLYGTGAFSGLVNLVTRPREEPNQVEVGFGGYDNGALHGRAAAHYHFTKDAGAWASVSAARSAGYDLPVPELQSQLGNVPVAHGTDAFTSIGTAGRFYYKSLTAQWFYHQREQKIPVGGYGTTFDDPRSHFDDRRYMAEVRFEPRLSDKWQVLARAHANRYEFHSVYEFAGESGASENREALFGTWVGAEARVVYNPAPWLRITAGGEGQYHPEATLEGASYDAKGKKTTTYLSEKAPYQFGAGYGLIEGSPARWFKFVAGARVDVYSTFGPIVVPRAALIFKPAAGDVIKVMGGRAFRAPSIYEQEYNDGGQSTAPGNQPDRNIKLGPESIYSGEIEYSHRFLEDWIALGAVHASYVEGLMTTVPDTPGSSLFRYANSTVPAFVAGADVELRRDFRRGFMMAATYGFQHTRFLDGALANPRLPNAPEHLASFRAVAPVVKELVNFGARFTLESPRRIGLEDSATTGYSVVADATVSGYIRDIGLRYVVGVYNIADRRYEIPVADTFATRLLPQNGRTFLIDAIWNWP
ncbi:MAG: TonB-dependent receptor [Polyangiaceae bacterium]